MTQLTWNKTGEKFFETGVEKGVLYPMDSAGVYPLGVPWNGLQKVDESPSGGEPTALWADNAKYLTLISTEELALTIDAYTYPKEFALLDGSKELVPGMHIHQQPRGQFGLVYQSRVGNDIEGTDHGYLLHLVYGCSAKPSQRSYQSINESPEANTFSWEISTTPGQALDGSKPSTLITIDSRTAPAVQLAALEAELFGTETITANLPSPAEVLVLMTA